MLSGDLKCQNCETRLHLRWVAVQEEYRSHHVDTGCPYCGDSRDIQSWLAGAVREGRHLVLLSVMPTNGEGRALGGGK